MRTLKECQAEVFRRSNQKIKARRQRRGYILAACIPAALCIAAFLLIPPPAQNAQNDAEKPLSQEAEPGSPILQESTASKVPVATKIHISGPDTSLVYTEAEQLQPIYDQLQAYVPKGSAVNTSGTGAPFDGDVRAPEDEAEVNAGDDRDFASAIADSATAGYTITVTTSDGGTSVYHLVGTRLENKTADQVYSLSAEQTASLLQILGLSQP